MKTFKYKWKIKDQEIIGIRDAESRDSLCNHVKNIGGELIEILEETEKVKETASTYNSSSYSNMKRCSFCGEQIKAEAIKCRHCGEMLNKAKEFTSTYSNPSRTDPYRPAQGGNNGLAITSFILGILGVIAIGFGFLFALIAVCLGPGGRNSKYSALASWGIGLGWLVIIGYALVWLFWGTIFGGAFISGLMGGFTSVR